MSMYNRKTLMGCLPLVASIMSRTHGVRVTVGGDTAYATPDKQINIPELPLDMTPHNVKMTRGYLDHECGHQRDTDFNVWARARQPFLKDLLNYIEDVRIERKMAEIYPGCRENFNYLNHKLYDRPFAKPSVAMQAAMIPSWICCALYGLDYPKISLCADEIHPEVETAYPGLLNKLEPLIQEAGNCQSTLDAFNVAEEMVKVIRDYLSHLPRVAPPSSSISLNGKGAQPGAGDQSQTESDSEINENSGEQQNSGGQGNSPDLQGHSSANSSEAATQSSAASNSQKDGTEASTCSRDATQSLHDMLTGNHRVHIPESTGERLQQLLNALSANCTRYEAFRVAEPGNTRVEHLMPMLLSGAKAATRVLSTRLRGLLQTMTLSRFSSGRRGKVDGGRLHRLAVNSPKVFARESPSIDTDTLVHILMDRSGSMSDCIGLACSACYATAAALHPIKGVSTAVTVFPADSGYATVTELLKPGQAPHTRFATGVEGYTPMGEAVWWVLQQMIHQPQKRKILLLITDGEPDSRPNALKAFDMAKTLNIELHGIGIGETAEPILDLIQGSRIIHNINELAGAMFAVLQNALTAR